MLPGSFIHVPKYQWEFRDSLMTDVDGSENWLLERATVATASA